MNEERQTETVPDWWRNQTGTGGGCLTAAPPPHWEELERWRETELRPKLCAFVPWR